MSDDAAKELYSLELKGEGVTVTRQVSPEVARAVLNLVLGGQASYTPIPGTHSQVAPPTPVGVINGVRPRVSLREYLDECEAGRNPDKITAIGSYMVDHDGAADFSRDEIKARFRTAGEPIPANFPRDFSWALKSGWIAEDSQSAGRFYLTQKGRAAIAAKFSADVKKPQPKRSRRVGRREGGEAGGDE